MLSVPSLARNTVLGKGPPPGQKERTCGGVGPVHSGALRRTLYTLGILLGFLQKEPLPRPT